MKELSIEEKAKRYDGALERAKELHSEDAPRESMDACEYIFPELAESKDEKIKQLLIRFVKYDMSDNYSDDFTPSDCIAWLEKQCEQKPSEDEDREYACQSSEHFTRRELMIYNRGIADGKRMIEDTIKETEQKPAWSEEDEEIKNIISGTLDLIYEKNICFENKSKNDCMFWLNSLIMRVQPQPKQEWSEEDEKKRTLLIDILEVNHPNGYFKVNPVNTSNMEAMYTEELISWLKSLKPHSKQEWNEGDEAMLKCCINSLELTPEITESYFVIDGKHITSKELQNWLKSLKPSYHCDDCKLKKSLNWKPTKEQMGDLLEIEGILRTGSHYILATRLVDLYKELKTL